VPVVRTLDSGSRGGLCVEEKSGAMTEDGSGCGDPGAGGGFRRESPRGGSPPIRGGFIGGAGGGGAPRRTLVVVGEEEIRFEWFDYFRVLPEVTGEVTTGRGGVGGDGPRVGGTGGGCCCCRGRRGKWPSGGTRGVRQRYELGPPGSRSLSDGRLT